MRQLTRHLAPIALGLSTTCAIAAAPTPLVIHNQTDVQSKAFVAGTIPPTHAAEPGANTSIPWIQVKLTCTGHTTPDKRCPAMVRMNTKSATPFDLGWVYINLDTGVITTERTPLSANGYTLIVNGPKEVTLVKN